MRRKDKENTTKIIGWYNKSSNHFFCSKCFIDMKKSNKEEYDPIKEESLENDIYTCDKCGKVFDKKTISNVIIFTTPILDGIKIKEYKGLVTAKNVRAIDFLRDFATSFRDFFGGRSGSYQEIMEKMEEEAINEIKLETQKLGANAIIGFSIDFDNIGSKGKSLLMTLAKGTAVVIEWKEDID